MAPLSVGGTTPTKKIYEIGNDQSVGSILDIHNLAFTLESLDASFEMEAPLTGKDYSTDASGTQ